MKISILKDDCSDIIISDHMNDGEKIATNLMETNIFSNVTFVRTLDFKKKGVRGRIRNLLLLFFPQRFLSKMFKIKARYDVLYLANADLFSKLLFHTISNDIFCRFRNKKLSVNLFEDGVAIYTKMFGRWFNNATLAYSDRIPFYHPKNLYQATKKVYVFDKEGFQWSHDLSVELLPKIDINQENDFLSTVNKVFGYSEMKDKYDKKYIFMEESFYVEKQGVDDIGLLNKIAEQVGKENIMVKIHPRNPVNRFKELGYKTNEDTCIPWEVIIANQDMSDKTLLTVSSSSVLNPARIFGIYPKVELLYTELNEIPPMLRTGLLDVSISVFDKYYKNQEE